MNLNPTFTRFIATVAFAGTLLVNALANILPINNLNTGQVSELYPSLFTPAGVTFSIWSIIYLMLLGFVIYSWMKTNDAVINAILPWFILTCVFNMTWIMVWHYLLVGTSVLIMLGLLLTMIKIFVLINDVSEKPSYMMLVTVPFVIYLAWICVATIANISAFLVSVNWNAFSVSQEVWALLMMGVAAFLGVAVLIRHGKYEFVLVVIWALTGIFLRWRNSEYDLITYGSIILCILLAISIITRAAMQSTRKAF